MSKVFAYTFIVLMLSCALFAQQPKEQPAWNVTLEANKKAPSNITVQNRCKKKHSFEIRPENVPFLEISQTELKVKGGKDKLVPVMFNTINLIPKTYEGQVLVICTSCKKEPTCTQDRETLPVILNVHGDLATNNNKNDSSTNTNTDQNFQAASEKSNPCDEIEKKCEDLKGVFDDKARAAKEAQEAADKAKGEADKAEQAARDAKEAAEKAENAANPNFIKSSGSITSDGETFYTSDQNWLKEKRRKLLEDYQAGKMTAQQYQQRVRNLMGREALKQAQKERKAYLEKLKKEAKEAKKKAEDAQTAANTARGKANAAQGEANKTKEAAEAAHKAYEECIKKAEEECEKWKTLQAEEKKKADEAERIRLQEERRQQQEEYNRKKKRERTEYLLTMIQRLGLIDSSIVAKVPSIWFWLPDIIETPVGFGLEAVGKTPIPTDTFKALGEVYGLFAKMKDPCAGLGISKISERLERDYINPKTGKKYTRVEGVALAKELCDLMREIKSKSKAISQAQKGK